MRGGLENMFDPEDEVVPLEERKKALQQPEFDADLVDRVRRHM